MPTEYLYIDDEVGPVVSHLDLLRRVEPTLTIQSRQPATLGSLVTDIREWLRRAPLVARGLILDWRLSDVPPSAGQAIDFRFAGTLAQELRSRASDPNGGTVTDVPIVLLSSDERLTPSYYGDGTSQDLFDAYIPKQSLPTAPEAVARLLVALADGYEQLRAARTAIALPTVSSMLKYPEPLAASWDARIDNAFAAGTRDYRVPAHRIARFIQTQLLDSPGPLIGESMLAALIGVDRDASGAAWTSFLGTHLSPFRYSGPFAIAFERWWSDGLYRWWSDHVDATHTFASRDSASRVETMRVRGFDGLVAATSIDPGHSTRFDTVCAALDVPLDSTEGFRLASADKAPWQYTQYLSPKAVRERVGYGDRGFRVHPLDANRAQAYLASLPS